MVLGQDFFNRPTHEVAKDLLGKFLVRQNGQEILRGMIVEIEVYDGFRDLASHAAKGKTLRNAPMFGPAGYWYVYFTYGMHWMLNVVTRKVNYPAAILIRGLDTVKGPARLTKLLKIDKSFDNQLANIKTGLWMEDGGVKIVKSKIKNGPRIGVDYAGPYYSRRRLRFWID